MSILAIDLETYSDLDLTKVGGYKYAENSEILLFAYAFDEEPVKIVDLASGDQLPKHVKNSILNKDVLKTAFNAQFERTVLSQHFQSRKMLSPEDWFCTMIQAYTLGLPGRLQDVCKVFNLSEDKAKMSVGKQLIQYFCKPCKPTKANGGRTRNLPCHCPEKWEMFKEYCRRDVETERTIRLKMKKFMPNDFERKLWFLDQRINDRGVKMDMKLVANAIKVDADFKEEIMTKARKLTGIYNPNSRKQVLDWLEEQDGDRLEKLDKAAVTGLLAGDVSANVRTMLEYKQLLGKASVKKYKSMLSACCNDGRGHGLLQFYGASRTGRWAGRLVQLHNLPRNYMDGLDDARYLLASDDTELFECFYDNVPDVLSQLIRTAFVAEEGYRFIVADFSAIEARIIAWLANEKWRMSVFANDGDIYCSSASQMFHVPVEKHGLNSQLRQKGKIAELALGYQGGPGALIQMGALEGGLTEEELPDIVRKWRKASPSIVKMWWDCEKYAIQAVKERSKVNFRYGIQFAYESGMLFIRLPSGRRIAYVKPCLNREECFNKLGLTYEGSRQDTKKKGGGTWIRQHTYGGKIVENIVQATARDCLAVAMIRLEKAGYKIVMHVHDEVILEMRNETGSLKEACQIMGRPIEWADGLLLKAEGYETDYYKKD